MRGADGAGPGAVARNADCALRVAAPHGRVHTPCGRTPAILRGIRGPSGHERELGLELLVELRIGFRVERGPHVADDWVETDDGRRPLSALPVDGPVVLSRDPVVRADENVCRLGQDLDAIVDSVERVARDVGAVREGDRDRTLGTGSFVPREVVADDGGS